MKKIVLLTLTVLIYSIGFSQSKIIYTDIESSKLDATRKLKIQLPRNYSTNVDKKYPVVLVLDGDYLFEPVAGNVDYFSYWEDMPESIVVGVMQGELRYADCLYNDATSMPEETGADFFEFIGMELMPYIDKEFRTAKFVIGVGHDFTANFINYYLFKDPILFNGYINLSPDFAYGMEDNIAQRIPNIKSKVFYYLATGSNDIIDLKESSEILNRKLAPLKNSNFIYHYDNFEDATHYSLVGRGIPNALEKIFTVYRAISKKEYSDVLLLPSTSPYDYLIDKYNVISDLFGITNNIRINDFLAVGTAAEKKKDWESLRKIGELARKQYPDKIIGHYYIGRYFEESGNAKKAMRTFQAAFDREEVDYITVDLLLDRADKIKSDFGY